MTRKDNLLTSERRKKFFMATLPILVIIVATIAFTTPILYGRDLAGASDWDLILSYYYPVRESFLAHQFPWWNPYNSGGIPSFGNPQVGVFSLQTPLILAYGVVVGLKYAAILYYVLGATGMYLLIRKLGSPSLRAVLLSLAWTFSSFTAFHFYVGHYTFLTYLLVPWLFYLLLKVNDRFWLFPVLGLGIALFINTAFHNIVIQALVFMAVASPFIWWTGGRKLKTLRAYMLALAVAAPLALPKLLFSYQFVSQFNRESEPVTQLPIPWYAAWRALTTAHQTVSDTSLVHNVGWWEVSAFIGGSTIIIAVAGAILSLIKERSTLDNSPEAGITNKPLWQRFQHFMVGRRLLPLVLCLLAVLIFDIALGNGLYQGLLHLPGFNLMRVPSRWLAWVIFPIILAAGAFQHKWRYLEVAICLALLITVGQQFAFIRPQFKTTFTIPVSAAQKTQAFDQFDHYPVPKGGYTGMYEAELAGYGEVRGYEAVLGYNWDARQTARCGVNKGCSFLSKNAELVYWSPNIIKIRRLGDGPITVNINPSSYLWVNDRQAYPNSKVAELLETVVINDPASLITLEMRPSL